MIIQLMHSTNQYKKQLIVLKQIKTKFINTVNKT
jgi:hypothetical protein